MVCCCKQTPSRPENLIRRSALGCLFAARFRRVGVGFGGRFSDPYRPQQQNRCSSLCLFFSDLGISGLRLHTSTAQEVVPPRSPASRLRAAPGSRRAWPTLLARPPSGLPMLFERHSSVQMAAASEGCFRGEVTTSCVAHACSLLADALVSPMLRSSLTLTCAQFRLMAM